MSEVLYRLKPPEWKEEPHGGWTAEVPHGHLTVSFWGEGEWWWAYWFSYYDEGRVDCDSPDDGKAKAEAYYRDWLLKAFDPVTQ